jgi:hypothetical protein
MRSQENEAKRRRKGPWIGGGVQLKAVWLVSLILASEGTDEMKTKTTRQDCFKWEMGNGEG